MLLPMATKWLECLGVFLFAALDTTLELDCLRLPADTIKRRLAQQKVACAATWGKIVGRCNATIYMSVTSLAGRLEA
jgi:hypothetical protein